MSIDEAHVALPRLYGASAYSTPRSAVVRTALPMGPDDLPIENYRSAEDRALAVQLMARPAGAHTAAASAGSERAGHGHSAVGHRVRPFLVRALAGRLGRAADH